MTQASKSWYYTCSKWINEYDWHRMGPMTLDDVLEEARLSHFGCDVFIQDLEEKAVEIIKVGGKYHWTHSKSSPLEVLEVEVVWIGAPSPYPFDGPVVLIDVPGREYYKRYVLVPARVLQAKPGPCTATMRVAGLYVDFRCVKLEGHVDKHKAEVNLLTPGTTQAVPVHWE